MIVNNAELMRRVTAVTGVPRETVDQVASALFEQLMAILVGGNSVEIRELGRFSARMFRERRSNREKAGPPDGLRRQVCFRTSNYFQRLLNPAKGDGNDSRGIGWHQIGEVRCKFDRSTNHYEMDPTAPDAEEPDDDD